MRPSLQQSELRRLRAAQSAGAIHVRDRTLWGPAGLVPPPTRSTLLQTRHASARPVFAWRLFGALFARQCRWSKKMCLLYSLSVLIDGRKAQGLLAGHFFRSAHRDIKPSLMLLFWNIVALRVGFFPRFTSQNQE